MHLCGEELYSQGPPAIACTYIDKPFECTEGGRRWVHARCASRTQIHHTPCIWIASHPRSDTLPPYSSGWRPSTPAFQPHLWLAVVEGRGHKSGYRHCIRSEHFRENGGQSVPVQRFRTYLAARGCKGIDLWAPWAFPGPTTHGAHV
jgi:hypothetical protein